MANKASTPSTITDAMHKYYCHRIPDSKIKMADLNQNLADASAFASSSTIESSWMGNPTSVTVFLNSDTAATITISLSAEGTRWYEASSQVLTAGGSAVVSLPGAGYVQLSTSSSIASFNADVICNY